VGLQPSLIVDGASGDDKTHDRWA